MNRQIEAYCAQNTAYAPRKNYDILFPLPAGSARWEGLMNATARRIAGQDVANPELWKIFVNQFRIRPDSLNCMWRCEFWGKMMRGACMTQQYTGDDGLYAVLEDSVRDLFTAADDQGRIATYEPEYQFRGWDLWGRKYVLLGLQHFMEICRDEELKQEIVAVMCRHADILIKELHEQGIQPCDTSNYWLGINSSSILEPMVRLYNITGKQDYLDFATEIVEGGGAKGFDLFSEPLKSDKIPSEYPVVKAYEAMSCFEGLLEYGRATQNEAALTAALTYGRRVLENEISVIGCAGCTHELFDLTRVAQFDEAKAGTIMQETCVTVTWMKFCLQMLSLTGDMALADAMETAYYNSLVGAVNHRNTPHTVKAEEYSYPLPDGHVPEIFPFDSYAPLTPGARGQKQAGCRPITETANYTCCTAIAAAGTALMPNNAAMLSEEGLTVLFYEQGEVAFETPAGQAATLKVTTEYPLSGDISFELILPKEEEFTLSLRIPAWAKEYGFAGFRDGETSLCDGLLSLTRVWKIGDKCCLALPIKTTMLSSADFTDNDTDPHYCLTHGPLVLAMDTEVFPFDFAQRHTPVADENGTVKATPVAVEGDYALALSVPFTDGTHATFVDYASAGKSWRADLPFACWLRKG